MTRFVGQQRSADDWGQSKAGDDEMSGGETRLAKAYQPVVVAMLNDVAFINILRDEIEEQSAERWCRAVEKHVILSHIAKSELLSHSEDHQGPNHAERGPAENNAKYECYLCRCYSE